ncbi:hypothetical protein JCM16303_005877 [Sporobolomyces ruberrimus]
MSRTASDRYQRQLLELVKQPGNNQCADCKASNPRWASWDQGVFLCVKCASMHRKIGSHITKVKSLTLDTWSKEQVDNMRKLGNVKVNSLLNPDERRNPPPHQDSDDSRNSELERFVRNKYEYKVYQDFDHPPPSSPALSPPPPTTTRNVPPQTFAGIPSRSNIPTPPIRTNSQTVYSPPPGPPPSLPTRTPSQPLVHAPSFPAPSSVPAPTLPTRSSTLPKQPKSVRFPSSPPTQIPSPPDSDDDDEEDSYSPPPQSRHRTLPASSTRSILVRNAQNREIPIDWAALTREPPWVNGDDDDQDDVPLQALGALGMKGAQVGLVGVPTQQGNGVFTPMAMYGAMEQQQVGMMGPGQGGVKPLMPQFTGSAKGYLHQLHAGTFQPQQGGNGMQQQPQPQMLVPQMTGSVSKSYGLHHGQQQGGAGGGGMDGDSFMRMFQPPTATTNPNMSGGGGQQQNGPNGSQFQPPQQQQQPVRTNPFTQFAAPTPQQPPPQQQQNQLQPPSASIWDDLTSLSPSPSSTPQPPPQQQPSPQPLRPQLTGFVPSSSFGQQLAREASPAPPQQSNPSTSSQFLNPNDHRSNSPFASTSPSSVTPQPSPLKPQYTGFVPSSSFGQSFQSQNAGGGGQPPQPLQPQRTGFVPSSSFGQQLAKDLNGPSSSAGGGGGGGANENRTASPGLFDLNPNSNPPVQQPSNATQQQQPSPGLFDFDLFAPSSSKLNAPLQPPQPQFAQPTGQNQNQRTSSPNPFLNFSNQFANALPPPPPPSQQPPSTQNQYSNAPNQFSQPTGNRLGGNPFLSNSTSSILNSNGFNTSSSSSSFLQPQNTGYQQQHQQFSQRQQQPMQPQLTGFQQQQQMRPQLTGFAGANGGNTNPFLMMGQNGGYGGGGNGGYR